MTHPEARLHVYIQGMVQGVGFRHATNKQATKLGLTGWVRNCDDGRVEAVFEGSRASLEEMLAWCKKGAALSRVENVDAQWDTATGEFQDFQVVF